MNQGGIGGREASRTRKEAPTRRPVVVGVVLRNWIIISQRITRYARCCPNYLHMSGFRLGIRPEGIGSSERYRVGSHGIKHCTWILDIAVRGTPAKIPRP